MKLRIRCPGDQICAIPIIADSPFVSERREIAQRRWQRWVAIAAFGVRQGGDEIGERLKPSKVRL